ncbi:MAG: ATP-binding cassette domain-containing protein, partial [Candidatus Angelobacter sp.]
HTYYREKEDTDFVLGPLDLSFRPGEIVFITGGNGCGKTTLVKLLTGLYVPESGHIVFDGEPVDHGNRELYSQHFSVIFSDFYLFATMHGMVSPTLDEQGRDYLQRLQLSHKVSIENGRFSTTELSQGQRKRLALLTAFIEDRPIFVFDEWAADQDPYFKNIFYTQLLQDLRLRKKAVFVISHDERYYHVADRVIKLDNGQVVSDMPYDAATEKTESGRVRVG